MNSVKKYTLLFIACGMFMQPIAAGFNLSSGWESIKSYFSNASEKIKKADEALNEKRLSFRTKVGLVSLALLSPIVLAKCGASPKLTVPMTAGIYGLSAYTGYNYFCNLKFVQKCVHEFDNEQQEKKLSSQQIAQRKTEVLNNLAQLFLILDIEKIDQDDFLGQLLSSKVDKDGNAVNLEKNDLQNAIDGINEYPTKFSHGRGNNHLFRLAEGLAEHVCKEGYNWTLAKKIKEYQPREGLVNTYVPFIVKLPLRYKQYAQWLCYKYLEQYAILSPSKKVKKVTFVLPNEKDEVSK
jgi:hypothetical protein